MLVPIVRGFQKYPTWLKDGGCLKEIFVVESTNPHIVDIRSLKTLRCSVLILQALIMNALSKFVNVKKIG